MSCLSLFIPILMIGLTARKQSLHDKIAGTMVVRRGKLTSARVF